MAATVSPSAFPRSTGRGAPVMAVGERGGSFFFRFLSCLVQGGIGYFFSILFYFLSFSSSRSKGERVEEVGVEYK